MLINPNMKNMGVTQRDIPIDDNSESDASQVFGGEWTLEKLELLEKYLNAFTTALKNQPFQLVYIDGFAGTGKVEIKRSGAKKCVDGSAQRALDVTDRPFDKLYFVEKDSELCEQLQENMKDDRCEVRNTDFNVFVKDLGKNWTTTRGVLFLDPFGAAVDWSTMERIADLNIDAWILYPWSTILRLLPTEDLPSGRSGWAKRLDRFFGGNVWRRLYTTKQERIDEGESHRLRESAKEVSQLYKKQLQELFGDRFLDETHLLKSSKNVLFEFMFCAGNPRGRELAHKIAGDILTKIRNSSKSPDSTMSLLQNWDDK